MDPRPLGRADGVLDDVDEGGHVVVGDALAVVDRGDQLGVTLGARARTAAAASRGMTPTSAQPSTARSSTSSHISSRASSVNSAAISGSE